MDKTSLADSSSPSLLSSRSSGWSDIAFEHCRLPGGEVPVRLVTTYQFNIHLGRSARLDVEQNGVARRAHFQRGHIIYTPPGIMCGKPQAEAREVLNLELAPALVMRTAEEMGLGSDAVEVPRLRFRDPFVEQVGIELWGELRSGRQSTNLYADVLASALAQHLLRRYAPSKARSVEKARPLSPSRLSRVIELLEDRLTENLRLAELAEVAGMSVGHFTRAFRRSTGQSPYQYVLGRRVEEAKRLLSHSSRSSVEIALDLGFNSQSHFIKVFRQHVATTPERFRSEVCGD